MSLPEGLEALLRAAYEAGAKGATTASSTLEEAMDRVERFDVAQSGVYGRASKDVLRTIRNSLSHCPRCGHAPHGSWCANMASDGDCSCTYDPAGEWIDTIEMGDRLSAIAGLADATEKELPSLAVQTPVRFKEGTFVVESFQSNLSDGMSINLVDASRYLENRTVVETPQTRARAQNNVWAGPPKWTDPVILDDRPDVLTLARLEHVHLRTVGGLRCMKDRSGTCTVPKFKNPNSYEED